LHYAFIGDHVEVAKAILETPEGKTLLSVTDGDGNSPLYLAVSYNRIDSVHFILRQPCINKLLNSENKDGETPLHSALIRGRTDVIRAVLEIPEDKTYLSITNEHGDNSLHLAVRHGSIDAVRLILEQPCAKELLNSKNKDGKTPWQLAFKTGYNMLEIHKELFAVFLVDVKRFLLELTKTSLMIACAGVAIALAIRYTTGPIWTGTAYFKGTEDTLEPFLVPSTLTETVTNYFADKLKYHADISVTDNLIDNIQIF
jgi:ankyrin repeat protein